MAAAAKMGSSLRGLRAFVFSRKFIPILKGTIAYVLGLVLIFLHKFEDLAPFPPTLSSLIVITIAGGAGLSVGACLQGAVFATLGICAGAFGYWVLAQLHGSGVAQGVVFAVFVYLLALVKAQGQKFFATSLLAIIFLFNGIYITQLTGTYSPLYLKSYLYSFLWGIAIVLGVNWLVLPYSSERDLRATLVLSLEHLGTFAHLLSKSYTLTITQEEKVMREHLAQTIRADFGLLMQKIADTSLEINYSRFSLKDYQTFVLRTRALQQALITAHSSLVTLEKKDVGLFKSRFLESSLASFTELRKWAEITVREIKRGLQCERLRVDPGQPGYGEYMDLEGQAVPAPQDDEEAQAPTMTTDVIDQQLQAVSRRLAEEVGAAPGVEDTTTHDSEDDTDVATPAAEKRASLPPATSGSEPEPAAGAPEKPPYPALAPGADPQTRARCVSKVLVGKFDKFAAVQHDILLDILISGALTGPDRDLRIHMPQPPTSEVWKSDMPAPGQTRNLMAMRPAQLSGYNTPHNDLVRRNVPAGQESTSAKVDGAAPALDDEPDRGLGPDPASRTEKELEEDAIALANYHSLLRVYSFLFALRIYIRQLDMYNEAVTKFDTKKHKPPRRRLQFHFFQLLRRPHTAARKILDYTPPSAQPSLPNSETGTISEEYDEKELSVAEAIALLEGKTYTPVKKTIWERIQWAESLLRTPTSIFAAKTAAAASVFATLALAHTTRQFFINYSLTGGVLTLVVSIWPTLGQSLLTFIFQILGSGAGYLWSVAILMMFKNVGGYSFNPFGIICLLGLTAMPLQYFIYYDPKFFVFALLLLNSAGLTVSMQWIYHQDLHRPFDTPILRAGKGFTALGIALVIAITFQLFVLRNPARRTLRLEMAKHMYATLSYTTLFQALMKAVLPTSLDKHRPPLAAVKRVERELIHREIRLQANLINMRPLMVFAAAEPAFSKPFRGDLANRVIGTSSVVLDRIREARFAIGHESVPDSITRNFLSVLAPYRRRNTRIMNSSMYLVASSLMTKTPLPSETPASLFAFGNLGDFMHDALVISSDFARTEEGKEAIRNGELTRYWAYMSSITSVGEQLMTLETTCRDLFGDLESKLA